MDPKIYSANFKLLVTELFPNTHVSPEVEDALKLYLDILECINQLDISSC